jgi:methylated-DNA-[protein]-cysteine S-methyltransferase
MPETSKFHKAASPDTAPETFSSRRYHSPLGTYILISSQKGVVFVTTEDEADTRPARWQRYSLQTRDKNEHNDALAEQLNAYFAGKLRRFSVPLDLRGTPFQHMVWELTRKIPYGETRSYRQIARALHRPNSARAVGRALNRNPISIVVPCHRVIGSNGKLTGYAGGLHKKRALLDLEATARC